MNQSLTRTLAYGVYEPTDHFRSIAQHSCVCFADDLGLVAVTGPAGDPQSERYAELFAAAPALLAACEAALPIIEDRRITEGAMGSSGPDEYGDGGYQHLANSDALYHIEQQLRLAIAEARGEKG